MRKIVLMLATVAALSLGGLAGTARADHGWGGYGHGHHHHSCGPVYGGGYCYRPYHSYYYGDRCGYRSYYGGGYYGGGYYGGYQPGIAVGGRGFGVVIGF